MSPYELDDHSAAAGANSSLIYAAREEKGRRLARAHAIDPIYDTLFLGWHCFLELWNCYLVIMVTFMKFCGYEQRLWSI